MVSRLRGFWGPEGGVGRAPVSGFGQFFASITGNSGFDGGFLLGFGLRCAAFGCSAPVHAS